jgi:hypothetical protein
MKVYGPYWTDSCQPPRRFVIIHYDDGSKKTRSYARHILGLHLGRELRPDEDADHIDGNPQNDDISNLRAIPSSENRRTMPPPEMHVFTCPICGVEVSKPARRVRHNRKQGKAGPFCGKQCSRKWQLEQR